MKPITRLLIGPSTKRNQQRMRLVACNLAYGIGCAVGCLVLVVEVLAIINLALAL